MYRGSSTSHRSSSGLERIHRFAESHYTGDPKLGAKLYYEQCQREAPVVAAAHANSIWLTFNDPELDVLLPDLPKIYLYSYKPGRSRRPWFFCESPESS